MVASCSIETRSQGTEPSTEIGVGDMVTGDTVQVSISAPEAAGVGDAVPITLVVRNNRDRQIELHLTGVDIAYDIVVAGPDSSIIWRRLPEARVEGPPHSKTLAPRAAFILTDFWRPPAPGDYVIGASLPTDSIPLRARPVRLSVR